MRLRLAVFGMLLLAWVVPAHADIMQTGTNAVAIRPFVGAFIPTGDQRQVLDNAVLTGAEVGYPLVGPVHLNGTFAWTPSHAKGFADTRTNLYQYDVGAEMAHPMMSGSDWALAPFVGAGVGGRTYSLKGASSGQSDLDGYGALGAQLTMSRLGARVEARDYVSRFSGIEGGLSSSTRNDMSLTAALTVHL